MPNYEKREDIRVRRPEEHSKLLTILKDENIFSSFKNILVFAASLGYKKQIRLPFEKSGERIMLRIFDENIDIPFIHCLALAETKDTNILKREHFSDAVLIFEEYANGGLSIISEYIKDGTNALQSIELLINSELSDDLNNESNLNPFSWTQ